MNKLWIIFLLTAAVLQNCTNTTDSRSAQEVLRAVADKIIRETAFEYENVLQKPVLDLQMLDYKNQYASNGKDIFYSMSHLIVKTDTTMELGFDYTGAVKIFVNGKALYEGINYKDAVPKEIAYNMFIWKEKISVSLIKGKNRIMIKMVPVNDKPVFFMREIAETAEAVLSGKFLIEGFENNDAGFNWISVGEFPAVNSVKASLAKVYPTELEIKNEYQYQNHTYKWVLPKANTLQKLVIKDSNSYKRESYIEWHYANGTTLLGMLTAADALNDNTYSDFVTEVCSLNVANRDIFKKQFYEYYAIRGTNYRMFRKTMLDDAGAPTLPYLQTYLNTKDEMLRPVIDEMVDYVVNDQVRLEDGSFCRPEPVAMTIWADDLFMSVPLFVRMGMLTGETHYFDDAARQIINFNRYLFDATTGLYKHGWLSPTNEKTKVYWGRANGWIIWATSEALLYLPEDHPEYSRIQNIFKTHLEGLIKYQDESGMWHQVLDKPESFKETSCTAMYIIGIMRGVKNGWLDEIYTENAQRAWAELKKNILEDGTVKDICRGTGIGYDYEFYFNRKRFDNDPRGLGAVLTAAAEIMEHQEQTNGQANYEFD